MDEYSEIFNKESEKCKKAPSRYYGAEEYMAGLTVANEADTLTYDVSDSFVFIVFTHF